MLFGLELDYFSNGIPLIVIASILFSLFHRFFGYLIKDSRLNQDAIGSYFAVIGTLFAVLIGLIVFDATKKYSDAHEELSKEANSILEISSHLNQFKTGGAGDAIKEILVDYVDETLANDWNHLAHNEGNPKSREILIKMSIKIGSIEPKLKKEEIYLPILVQSFMEMAEGRLMRFDPTTHSIPSYEWIILTSSALLTLLSSLWLRVGSPASQSLMSFILCLSVLTSLYAILMFSEPYRGSFTISKNAMLTVQKALHGEYGKY